MSSDAPSATLPPGSKLGKYQIVRVLGQGGMGCVYEAVHPELKRRVAVKTLLPEWARSPTSRQRFLREGEAASRIRHPNVVDIFDVGTEGNTTFLVMEYLEGNDLRRAYATPTPLPLAEILDIMLPVLAAVGAAHEEGVVHRDLKPHNIFLAKGRAGDIVPKVLDFGLSKLLGGDGKTLGLTAPSAVIGTFTYMSPEQAMGQTIDDRTDQYSLGVILYELATGHRAHRGENTAEIVRAIGNGAFARPTSHRPDLPEAFEAAIVRAMAKQPGDRFPDVYALGRALLPFAGERARLLWERAFERTVPRRSAEVAIREDEPVATPKHDVPAAHDETRAAEPAAEPSFPPTQRIKLTPTPPPPSELPARASENKAAVAEGPPAVPSGRKTMPGTAMELAHGWDTPDGPARRPAAPAKPKGRPLALLGGLALAAAVVTGALLLVGNRGTPPETPAAAAPPSELATPTPAPAVPVAAPAPPATAAEAPRPPTPKPATFRLDFVVRPAETEIDLDGRPLTHGGTVSLDVRAGGKAHVLHLRAPGHEPQVVEVGEPFPRGKVITLRPAPAKPSAEPESPKEPAKESPEPAQGDPAAPASP